MIPERVLITGCGGMLGSAIYPYFVAWYKTVQATDKDVSEDYLYYLDVRDDIALKRVFMDFRPDVTLHLAAETDLEFCETYPKVAQQTNVQATETIARLAGEYGTTLVYISTAGVFDGRKSECYCEADQPKPIMTYGRTKYEGELRALQHCSRTFVVRAGWMMGGGRRKDKKFIYKILKQIREGRREIFAVDDRWGTPTYTFDFAMNLSLLISTQRYGVYHMVCEGTGTRFDVAREILNICRRHDIKLTRTDSEFFRQTYFAPRPVSEMLVNTGLQGINLNYMRPWKEALREYIEDFFPDYILPFYQSSSWGEADPQNPRRDRRLSVRLPRSQVLNCLVPTAESKNNDNSYTKAYIINKSATGACSYIFTPVQEGQRLTLWEDDSMITSRASVKWVSQKNHRIFKAGLSIEQ